MASLVNYACLLLPVALQLMCPLPSAALSSRRCGSIYRGFARCLTSLGDSMTNSARHDHITHEIHSICRSWDEFHDCANLVMAGCPEEAAAIWESLRHESKKMQFSGNLYDMCSNRNQPQATASAQAPPNQEDINQESLRAHAHRFGHAQFLLPCLCLLLLLLWIPRPNTVDLL